MGPCTQMRNSRRTVGSGDDEVEFAGVGLVHYGLQLLLQRRLRDQLPRRGLRAEPSLQGLVHLRVQYDRGWIGKRDCSAPSMKAVHLCTYCQACALEQAKVRSMGQHACFGNLCCSCEKSFMHTTGSTNNRVSHSHGPDLCAHLRLVVFVQLVAGEVVEACQAACRTQ